MEAKVTQGPLINDQQLKRVDGMVRDALSKGARIVCGGRIHPTLKGRFYEPTILADVKLDMEIFNKSVIY